jgi:hypothetical protein
MNLTTRYIGLANRPKTALQQLKRLEGNIMEMKQLTPEYKEFIALLNSNKVKYLVVGGFAMAFHGYPRFTGDFDIWVDISKDNSELIINTLNEFGFYSLGLQPEDFQKKDIVVQLGYSPNRIDILTSLTGLNFNECYKEKQIVTINDIEIIFIDVLHLIKNKEALGRHQDIADVQRMKEHLNKHIQ